MTLKSTLLSMGLLLGVLSGNAQSKYVGGDISLLKAYEDHGANYLDVNGNKIQSVLPYLKGLKMNAMRVRLFHTPANATSAEKGQGVIQDLAYVKKLGKQIKDNGFKFMLDFHYSDTWADPSNQYLPKAWEGLSDADLQDSLYNYTKSSLNALIDAGATPDFIQIGNEISYGMLWCKKGASSIKSYYAGKSTNRTRFTNLLIYAAKACREVCPDAKIILHTERVANPSYIVEFYKDMDNAKVDYDIIGTSYYSYYHGDLNQLETALKQIESNFSKDIMVVEAGYFHDWQPTDGSVTTDLSALYPINGAGQKAFTEALIETLNKHSQVKGLFWWEMDANEYGLDWNTKRVLDGWYNAGLWDNSTGKAEPAIEVLQNFLVSAGISGVSVSSDKDNNHTAYNLSGQKVNKNFKGIVLKSGKKYLQK